MEMQTFVVSIAKCMAYYSTQRNRNIEIKASKKAEIEIKRIREIEKILRDRFDQSKNTSILTNFLEEPEKYISVFEKVLQDQLEEDADFRDELKSTVTSFETSISRSMSIENGLKGPQGNRTSFIPRDEIKSIVTSFETSISRSMSIENGLKGPQGNRTSFIPLSYLACCPKNDCIYIVNMRTKGQRCPYHNEELQKWKCIINVPL